MVYLSVSERGKEILHHSRPTRKTHRGSNIYCDNYWYDYYGSPFDGPYDGIVLPKGTIKHLIGRELTFEDRPVCLSKNKVY
jgi:hypothetical protein